MRDRITPVILTYNEEPNIGRTLSRLTWAAEVIVLDSFSTDRTCEIARSFPNVRLLQREFDDHARQWTYALKSTEVHTEWVLAMDADYMLTDGFIESLSGLTPGPEVHGYRASFRYCVGGKPLRASLYPPVTVLYRAASARYAQDGHTQRLEVQGRVEDLGREALIDHDDRKPLSRWVSNQAAYARLEAEKLSQPGAPLSWKDRLHGCVLLSAPAVFLYCLLIRGLVLDGARGWYYACQRAVAEMLLAICLFERRWQAKGGKKEIA